MSNFQKIAVPATRSSAPVLKVRRRVMVVLLALCTLAGFAGLFMAVKANANFNNFEVPSTPNYAIAIAEEAGRDYLASRTSHVPAAKGVDTDWKLDATGQEVKKAFTATSFTYSGQTVYEIGDGSKGSAFIRLIRFRVVIGGLPYALDVPIAETNSGPVLADAPALLPAARQTTGGLESLNYTDLYGDAGTAVEPAVQASVENWAAVYAKAGPASAELQAVTRDQSTSHTYSGLDGWTGEVQQIISVLPVGGGDTGKPEGQIVQVRVVLTPPAANGPSLRTTYDLYVVTEGNPAQPPVIAWGPAGSAEDLAPFINAD